MMMMIDEHNGVFIMSSGTAMVLGANGKSKCQTAIGQFGSWARKSRDNSILFPMIVLIVLFTLCFYQYGAFASWIISWISNRVIFLLCVCI